MTASSRLRPWLLVAALCCAASAPAAHANTDLRSPDARDAARAGDIARAMEHYQQSQPIPAAARPASPSDDTPAWPEIALAGVVLLATAGGVVRLRLRRHHRVVA